VVFLTISVALAMYCDDGMAFGVAQVYANLVALAPLKGSCPVFATTAGQHI
jgi:hypothetical protein